MKNYILLPTLLLASMAAAQTKTFTMGDPKISYRNVGQVESESDYETFTGKTNQVTGTINFNPVTRTGSGSISVDVASIDTGIKLRNEHMVSEGWLNAAKYPNIVFKTGKVSHTSGDIYRVQGTLSLHGVTRPVTAMVKLRYRAAGDATRAAGFTGDVIQISTKFNINLSDYGVVIPAMAKGKVANTVTLGLSGYAVTN